MRLKVSQENFNTIFSVMCPLLVSLLGTSKKCVISSHDNLPRFSPERRLWRPKHERNFIFMSSLSLVNHEGKLRKSRIDTSEILRPFVVLHNSDQNMSLLSVMHRSAKVVSCAGQSWTQRVKILLFRQKKIILKNWKFKNFNVCYENIWLFKFITYRCLLLLVYFWKTKY